MSLEELFLRQKQLLVNFFDAIDLKKAEKIVEVLLSCQGTVFFTGIGKSGIIAEKLVMTLISTGIKAMYLSPTNALHGDIGVVAHSDLFIILSKSGESKELIQLIPYLKQRQVFTMAWVCEKNSTLAKECDFFFYLHVEKELCPFNLAPTTSAAAQLIFGDVLCMALMQQRGLTLQDFAKNHPAGHIGKKTLKVKDIMIKDSCIPTCHIKNRLKDCLVELTRKKCGCLLVVDDQKKVQGIFTDGDLRRALQTNSFQVLEDLMENLMTKQFLSVTAESYVEKALHIMQQDPQKWVMALPVIEHGHLVGLIHIHDAIRADL